MASQRLTDWGPSMQKLPHNDKLPAERNPVDESLCRPEVPPPRRPVHKAMGRGHLKSVGNECPLRLSLADEDRVLIDRRVAHNPSCDWVIRIVLVDVAAPTRPQHSRYLRPFTITLRDRNVMYNPEACNDVKRLVLKG